LEIINTIIIIPDITNKCILNGIILTLQSSLNKTKKIFRIYQMNMQITKNKNTYTDNSLKNRILRLERMLQQLLQMSINGGQTDNSAIKIENNKQNELISDLISSSTSRNVPASTTQPAFFPTKNSINNSLSNKNNISLSRGQVIAELALAIARASRRNS